MRFTTITLFALLGLATAQRSYYDALYARDAESDLDTLYARDADADLDAEYADMIRARALERLNRR